MPTSEESQETYARRRPSGEKAGFESTRFELRDNQWPHGAAFDGNQVNASRSLATGAREKGK